MVVLVLETSYNRNSEQDWSSCDHFKFLGSNPPLKVLSLFGVFIMELQFRGREDDPSIEDCIKYWKGKHPIM